MLTQTTLKLFQLIYSNLYSSGEEILNKGKRQVLASLKLSDISKKEGVSNTDYRQFNVLVEIKI